MRSRGAALIAATLILASTAWGSPGLAAQQQSTPAQVPASGELSAQQAIAQARKTGKAVDVTSEATVTDRVTANPNGTLTLTRHVVPVRKKIAGQWKDLDATLRLGADGSVAPQVTTGDLKFSNGGYGPLATMGVAGKQFGLSLGMALPRPELSGASATYKNVLPDVDLVLTATKQGGFTQVFVVHNAAAAANPALKTLTLKASGFDVTAAEDGTLTASDAAGRAVATASPPIMWDSAYLPGGFKSAEMTAQTPGERARSSVSRPGARATVARIGVKAKASTIELTPDAGLLNARSTVFPLFIDPAWSQTPTSGSQAAANPGYSSVAAAFPSSNKWNNTADPNPDNMQLGWNNNPWHARTMINFKIDVPKLSGATIFTAVIDATVVYSGSCTARKTRVFAPTTTLNSSNATWNNWYNNIPLGGEVSSATFSGGYNSNCPAHAISPPFNVLGAVNSAVAANRTVQTFVFTGDTNETSDTASYKELSLASLKLAITYNHTPSTPVNLTTSPQTSCTGTVGTVGDGDVLLYAPVSDPDGGTVGVRYEAWKSSIPGTLIASTDDQTFTASSGGSAVLTLGQATLRTQAAGAITEFSWRVRIYDGIAYSAWSATCKFNFDPTRPGAPFATPPADGTTQIGQNVTVNVTRPTGGTAPASYTYQVNTSAPVSVPADGSGNASITFKPTRRTNTVTIVAVSAGGNAGIDAAVITFTTAPKQTEDAANDLNGDGLADLLVVGANHGLPSGVWSANGRGTGLLATVAANLGVNGNGVVGDLKPSNFDSAQVITGIFTGNGVQDIFAYYPGTGAGSIIVGNGDGSAPLPQFSGNQFTITADDLRDQGTVPLQIANAGDLIGNGDHSADLIGIGGVAGGYHLNYYFYASTQNLQGIINLTPTTPAGDMAWDQWRIATYKSNMFLWKPSTGALHLWKNLDMSTGDLTFTAHQIAASGWNAGATLTLQASDVDGNGTPDLWAVGNNRVVTTYLGNGTTGLTAQAPQTLSTMSHTWSLNDKPAAANNGDTIASSADNAPTGALALAGTTGATWHTGDLYSPDAAFNGTGGMLATTGSALGTNADFSVSVWVKPTAAGGVVLSQDGGNTAGFKLHSDSGTKAWQFSLARTDTAGPVLDTISAPANSVQIGVWTQLTATFNALTGMMNLAVNGTTVATGSHTALVNTTGPFRVGAGKTATGTWSGYFAGQVANVQVWNHVIDLAGASRTLEGDLRADIMQNVGGTLMAYYNGGVTGTKSVNWDNPPGGYTVATGLGGVALYLADLNADGYRDLIRKTSDGTLSAQYYPWKGTGTWYTIGTGWTMAASSIYFPDMNGDRRAEIVKKTSGGVLEVYYNNGVNGSMGINWDQATATTGYEIGWGWNMPDTSIYFADLGGEGRDDIVYKNGTSLQAYYNNGINASKGVIWDYPYTIGTGWGMADTALYMVDVNGDNRADIIRTDTGTMNVYYNGGINGSKTVNWDYPAGGYVVRGSTPAGPLYIG